MDLVAGITAGLRYRFFRKYCDFRACAFIEHPNSEEGPAGNETSPAKMEVTESA